MNTDLTVELSVIAAVYNILSLLVLYA